MVTKQKKLLTISREYKEALLQLSTRPEFKTFISFLRTQQNNIALIEWARVSVYDPNLAVKKGYYRGQVDIINSLIEIFDKLKLEEENE